MANSTIPNLVAVTVPALTDLFGVRQSGDTRDKKLSSAQLKTLIGGVSITGTPANLQVAFWNPDGTAITGNVGLTFDTAALRNLAAGGAIRGGLSNAGGIRNVAASSTVPTLIPRFDDLVTGIGAGALRNLSVILDGDFGTTWQHSTAADNSIRQFHRITTGVTANTTQTQGNGLINGGRFTEVTTVANVDDVITLHNAGGASFLITIMNSGANRLQIFPPVGDTILGNALNASVTLDVNKSMTFYTVDASNWMIVSEPGAGASFPLRGPDGSGAAPTYSFTNDTAVGIYLASSSNLGVKGGGSEWIFQTNRFSGSADGAWMAQGTPAASTALFGPSILDLNTGIGLAAADSLTLVAGGVEGLRVTEAAAAITVQVPGTIQTSNAAGPQMVDEAASINNPTFIPDRADPDTGIGTNGGDTLSLICGGRDILQLKTDGGNQNQLLAGEIGTAILPTYSWFGDTGTGFFKPSAGNVGFATGGSEIWRMSSVVIGALISGGPAFRNEVASVTNPNILPNNADADSGIGQNAVDELSLIAGGFELLRISELGNAFLLSGTDPALDGGDLGLTAGDSGVGATGDGGAVNIEAGASVATAGDGGAVDVKGGAGFFTGKGGTIHHEVGSGGAAGPGTSGDYFVNTTVGLTAAAGLQVPIPGLVSIYGVGRSGAGPAGNLELWGGYASGAGAGSDGGDLLLFGGGQGGGAGAGGNAHLYGGESDTTPGFAELEGGTATVGGPGGAAHVRGGPGFGTNQDGGVTSLIAGAGSAGGGSGGSAFMRGGAGGSGAGSGLGGGAVISGGASLATDGGGGLVSLDGGVGTGTGDGGSISISGGIAGGTGVDGNITLTTSEALALAGTEIGFYATTPIALQTGVAVTIGAVHAALVALGLITA